MENFTASEALFEDTEDGGASTDTEDAEGLSDVDAARAPLRGLLLSGGGVNCAPAVFFGEEAFSGALFGGVSLTISRCLTEGAAPGISKRETNTSIPMASNACRRAISAATTVGSAWAMSDDSLMRIVSHDPITSCTGFDASQLQYWAAPCATPSLPRLDSLHHFNIGYVILKIRR